MSTPIPSSPDATPGFPGVEFGVSADGFPVALVGEIAFAMMPTRDGRHYLASAFKIGRPLYDLIRADFNGHSGGLSNEDEFRDKVRENAEHQRDKSALGRREVPAASSSPWGTSQHAVRYGEGVIFHSTAAHGGFRLAPAQNQEVLPLLRDNGGWYEEDEAWAIVALTFPALVTAFERRCAERTMKDSWPDAWEAMSGEVLKQGESKTKDRVAFQRDHADSWIVISAIGSTHQKGFVECIATRGGRRERQAQEQRFLVPSHEYEMGQFGFVIDPKRHASYDGPSDFVGWRGGRSS